MIFVHAQSIELFLRGGEVGLCILLSVFGLFQHGLRDGAVREQVLGAHEGLIRQLLVIGGFEVGVEGVGDVRALDFQKKLALLYVIVESSFDIDDAAIGHGDDWHLAIDVGEHRSGCG